MTVSAVMRGDLRRMVNEPNDENGYTDTIIDAIVGKYPLIDERGEVPYTWDTSTTPPTQDVNEDWIATYDLHAAAADIWQEKATSKADLYMFSADGGQYQRHQIYDMYMKQSAHHLSRRAQKSRRMFMSPLLTGDVVVNKL